MTTWARKRVMNTPFNMARTAEDRRAWRKMNAEADAMVETDSSLWAARSRWHDEGHRGGFKAGFSTFPEWLAAQSAATETTN